MSVFQILALVFFVFAFAFLAVSITVFFTNDIAAVIGDLSGKTAQKQIEQIRNQTTNMSYGVKKPRSNHNAAIDSMIDSTQARAEMQREAHKSHNLTRGTGKISRSMPPGEPVQTFKSTSKAVASDGTTSLDSINLTDKLSGGATQRAQASVYDTEADTDVLSDAISEMPTDVLNSDGYSEAATDVLNNDGYSEAATDVLSDDEIVTDVLSMDEAATDVLSEDVGATSVLQEEAAGTTVLSEQAATNVSFDIVEEETFINTDEVIE